MLCVVDALWWGAACTNHSVEPTPRSASDLQRSNFGSVFGAKRLSLQRKSSTKTQITGVVSVNKFLWQAALEILSFMPIVTADPQKGKLITGWYIDKQHLSKRVRVAVTMRGNELRADALKVYIDRQSLNGRKQI